MTPMLLFGLPLQPALIDAFQFQIDAWLAQHGMANYLCAPPDNKGHVHWCRKCERISAQILNESIALYGETC